VGAILTSQVSFVGVVLDSTTISKMVSEPLQDPLDHQLSSFRYQTIYHLCLRAKLNSPGREGVLRVSHLIGDGLTMTL